MVRVGVRVGNPLDGQPPVTDVARDVAHEVEMRIDYEALLASEFARR